MIRPVMPNDALKQTRRLFSAAAAVSLLVGCRGPTAPVVKPTATVTALTASGRTLVIEFEFRNRTNRTLYLVECGGNLFASVKLFDVDGKTDEWGTICLGIWVANVVPIAAGEQHRAHKVVEAREGARYSLGVQYQEAASPLSATHTIRAPTVRLLPRD